MAINIEDADQWIDRAVRALRALDDSQGPPADVIERVRRAGAMAAVQHAGAAEPPLANSFQSPIVQIESESKRLSTNAPKAIDEPRQPSGATVQENECKTRSGTPRRISSRAFLHRGAASLTAIVKSSWTFLGPVWSATVMASILLAGLSLTFLVPAEFRIFAKGTLEPKIKHVVFAGIDGKVVKLLVKSGAEVKADQPLVELQNTALAVQSEELAAKISGNNVHILQLRASRQHDQLSPAEIERNETDLASALTEQESYQKQRQLLDKKKEKLIVRSPIAGKVATFQLESLLANRPVQRGDQLLEVIDPTGDWELEIRIPGDQMKSIKKARHEIKQDLDVDFIQMANPGRTLHGTVVGAQETTDVRGDESGTVVVRVKINKADLGVEPQKGAGISARIDCGKRSLGYVWFRPIIELVQSTLVF
jgi:biotin carboxyl carrier protein